MQRISRLDNDDEKTLSILKSTPEFHKSVDPVEFLALARRCYINHNFTPGRAVVKAMEELNQSLAIRLKGSEFDPYYDSSRKKISEYLEQAIGLKNLWVITQMEKSQIYWLFPESFRIKK